MSKKSIKVNCDKSNLKKLRAFLNQTLVAASMDEQEISLIILAVDEICSNIIIHANHCDETKFLEMIIAISPSSVEVSILDKGDLFDYQSYNEPKLEALVNEKRKGSLGLMLVRRIMDKVEFKKEGADNICVMHRSLK